MVEPRMKLEYTIHKLPAFQETHESTIEAITKINGSAFEGDKFIELLLGGHWDLAPCLHHAFTIDFLKDGHVYVAQLEDGRIIANAMWRGPGPAQSLLKGDSNAEEEGFNKFMAALEQKDAEAAKWWKEYYMNKYASFTDGCLDGPEAKQGGWRLQVIGVLPEYQRYGIGATLIKVIEDKIVNDLELAPAERPKISLETESERACKFYQKIGFKERGATVIEGVGNLGNCPMWCFAKVL